LTVSYNGLEAAVSTNAVVDMDDRIVESKLGQAFNNEICIALSRTPTPALCNSIAE